MSDEAVDRGNEPSSKTEAQRQGNRVVMAWLVAGAVVLLAIFIVSRVQADRADDRRTDRYYCTLSGITPLDRAPNTGRLCADLLTD